MAFWSDIIGTTAGYLRLGFTGVRLKSDGGLLSVRNAADSMWAGIVGQDILTRISQSEVTISGTTTLTDTDHVGRMLDIEARQVTR